MSLRKIATLLVFAIATIGVSDASAATCESLGLAQAARHYDHGSAVDTLGHVHRAER